MSSDENYEKSLSRRWFTNESTQGSKSKQPTRSRVDHFKFIYFETCTNVSDLKRGQNEPLKSARSCLKTGEPANFKIGRSFPFQEYKAVCWNEYRSDIRMKVGTDMPYWFKDKTDLEVNQHCSVSIAGCSA